VNNTCNYELFQNHGFVASENEDGLLIKPLSAIYDSGLACAGLSTGVSSIPSLIL
jgi:hypothetical protein